VGQLATYTCKNLYKLKHADNKFKTVIVAHDMTRAERDECKRLVADAKAQSERDVSGEYQYKVRGFPGKMRVVKLRIWNQISVNVKYDSVDDRDTSSTVKINRIYTVNNVKVLYTNVGSLIGGTKREELQVIIKTENVQVVGLTETWGRVELKFWTAKWKFQDLSYTEKTEQ